MQAERLTCSPSFSITTTRQSWTTHHHQSATHHDGDFSFDCGSDSVSSPISADQIFHNGKIKPTLLFSQNSINRHDPNEAATTATTSRRKALQRLFIEDRDTSAAPPTSSSSSSSSSSEIDDQELESVPADSYCVWKPKTVSEEEEEEGRKVKRGDTASSGSMSRRWKLMDLLTRNSNQKVGCNSSKRQEEDDSNNNNNNNNKVVEAVKKKIGASGRRSPPINEGGGGGVGEKKRTSYLPYRQELVGIFGNSRNLQR